MILVEQVLLEAVDKMSLDALPKVAKRGIGGLVQYFSLIIYFCMVRFL